jgi:Transcriptional regulator, AbiEi antitoxin/Protein of unknown function (DUF559)
MEPDRDALDEHARRQRGLFTVAQARECGFTSTQIGRRRREGDWVELRRNVLAERGLTITPQVRDMAAHLVLPGAVLAGPSAARWHDIDVPSTGTFVVLDRSQHARPREVCVFRESISEQEICVIDGVCVTTVERAVFDCIRVLPDAVAQVLLERALEVGWTSLAQLSERIGGFTSRHGAPRLVRLLRSAANGSHSASQRLGVRLLQRAGIWGWLENEPVTDRWGLVCIGDIIFPRPMLVIEFDGRAYEPDGQRPRRERERHNRLLAAGWTVLRFSWYDLSSHPDQVVATIRQTLDRLGAHTR